jgi:chromate transporter
VSADPDTDRGRPEDAAPHGADGAEPARASAAARGRTGEVSSAFLRLGLTSFGGPVAHLAYFRTEFVARRRWLDEQSYAELIAVCQFLPGPASSKLGFTLGLLRAGWPGAFAAWFAFTLPSALAMYAFARGAASVGATPIGAGALHGLKLAAVAVVAHAAWNMARTLCPDAPRRMLAVAAAGLVLAIGGGIAQLLAIAAGGAVGFAWLRRTVATGDALIALNVRRNVALAAALVFALLLALALLAAPAGLDSPLAMSAAFYRAGALVFGGGHVVLPLLDAAVVQPGGCTREAFLAGYGAAQAIPGPLFTFAAFLGAQPGMPVSGAGGAALAVVAIFLPGLLLQVAALASWSALRARPAAGAALRGVNAAVVGVLVAALWDPVWTGSVRGATDALVAAFGFALLVGTRIPPWAVVAGAAAAGTVLGG